MSASQNLQVGEVIPNSFIVVLKAGSSIRSFQSDFENTCRTSHVLPEDVVHKTFTVIPGVHATLTPDMLQKVQADPNVAYVEEDKVFSIIPPPESLKTTAEPPASTWGRIRIGQRNLDLTQPYKSPEGAGEGITAYVIDTGVYIDHKDFGGRASWGHNFIRGSMDTDENGHGTHVAATIGGAEYGVANKVKIVSVKVLDAKGSGSTSGVIAGVDWVAQNAISGMSVVNMSLGGPKSNALNDAVIRLYDANIPVIAAAGNDPPTSADNQSPGSSPGAYTVLSMDRYDSPSTQFNSYGTCAKIFAPGEYILSAWIGSPTATKTISGTSMASPHVAGVVAIYLSLKIAADDVYGKLTECATKNKVQGDLKGMKNLIVFSKPVKHDIV